MLAELATGFVLRKQAGRVGSSMPNKRGNRGYKTDRKRGQRVTLSYLAEQLGLSPTTISLVINDAPLANTIAQKTKERIWEAVAKFNYQPNMFARYLHTNRTYCIAVLVPHIGDLYSASLLDGIETYLSQHGFAYFVVSHREIPDLIENSPAMLLDRAVEGMIFINTPMITPVPVPVVAISDLTKGPRVTRILVDNDRAGFLALSHLKMLGHSKIAFFRGPAGNGDSITRWEGLCKAARDLSLTVHQELAVELERYGQTNRTAKSDSGYVAAGALLSAGRKFTALVAFNDVSALGAVRAFKDAGLEVPKDVSVIGFDDIHETSFSIPRLTTIRQPLTEMGILAAERLLQEIRATPVNKEDILISPELIVRESTSKAKP
jgi:DNA-binding LacI/PurR family transcriptional regulator